MINLNNFLWSTIPQELADIDSYKDLDGRGLLERYVSIFDEELQEELVVKLENFSRELTPATAADQFLSEIAYSVGSPPDVMGGINKYREVLTSIIGIYKVKGTTRSYKLFFRLFGMDCRIVEHFPLDNKYDVPGNRYDDKTINAQPYDQNAETMGYIDYTIEYFNLPGYQVAPLNAAQKSLFIEAVRSTLEPIDCRLRAMNYIPPGSPENPYPVDPEDPNPTHGLPLQLPFTLGEGQ